MVVRLTYACYWQNLSNPTEFGETDLFETHLTDKFDMCAAERASLHPIAPPDDFI